MHFQGIFELLQTFKSVTDHASPFKIKFSISNMSEKITPSTKKNIGMCCFRDVLSFYLVHNIIL